jgi:hypothetical protein
MPHVPVGAKKGIKRMYQKNSLQRGQNKNVNFDVIIMGLPYNVS